MCRIQMTVSLSDTIETQKLFPLFVFLARLVSPEPTAEYSAVYKFSRTCSIPGVDGKANFLLPEMDRLALKAGSVDLLFISFGKQHRRTLLPEQNTLGNSLFFYYIHHYYGNITGMTCLFLQLKFIMSEQCVEIQVPSKPLTSSSPQQVQVTISAQEVGATENPPYRSSFSFNDFPASSVVLPINRLRKGRVAFNYRYYNNKLQKTEEVKTFPKGCLKLDPEAMSLELLKVFTKEEMRLDPE
ncbi:hypothetical protein DY000_02001528, partial [Brassica cretica]